MIASIGVSEYVVAALVVVLIGVSKAGFAGGTGVLATPLLCLVIDPRQAVGILLPVLCACDWISLAYYRKSLAWRPLLLCLPGGVIGVAAGGLLLGHIDKGHMKIAVGIIALLFVHRDFRRQGLGQALVAHLESICPREKIFTSTNESNLPMQRLLATQGFRPSGIIHNLDEVDPEIVYVKQLKTGE